MRRTRFWVCSAMLAVAFLPGLAHAEVGTVWMQRYAQPGYCNDEATAMHVDAAGNVYVTGSSQRSEAGLKDYATVKYNAAGVQQWSARFSSIGNSIPSAIVADGAGNVYVTGASESTGTYSDLLTVKYNAAGVEQWHDRYSSAGDCIDQGRSVCIDSSGNVAVCGVTSSVATSYDWVIIGYTAAGARRFVTPRTSAGGNPDEANGIVADPQGNYYVAGRLWYGGKMDDAVVTKYNTAGAEQWTASYDGPLSGDGAVAICRGSTGDLYATGWSVGPNDNADVLTMKVSAAGALLWTKRYAAPENANDLGTRIAVDASGNVRVTGRVQVGSGGDYDIVTLGYSGDSSEQFVNRLGSSSCTPGGIALDSDGHIFVCGSLAGDFLTLQYDGSAEAWRRVENFASGDAATAIGVDDSGYVYVTGRGDFGADAWDFVTFKYDPRAGIEELTNDDLRLTNAQPTIVRGVLFLPEAIGEKREARGELLDITGRKVLDLMPGRNDVGQVAPGVYFVEASAGQPAARVVIQR
jgi:hypothetical protein